MHTLRHCLLTTLFLITSLAPVQAANLVFMIGEDEYLTWETLPVFAKESVEPRGHLVTIIHADATDKNNFPGLVEALRDADLLLVSVRRRTPLVEQLDAIRSYLAAGKPLIGIRTASHAFALRAKDKLADPKLAVWQDFDPEVLGGHYVNHHGAGPQTSVTVATGADAHPILKDVPLAGMSSACSLYKVSPLTTTATPLLIGTIPDQPAEPIAWTNRFGPKQARVFYTSLGGADDFKEAAFRRLMLNAIDWVLTP